jgi:hypothetical protein
VGKRLFSSALFIVLIGVFFLGCVLRFGTVHASVEVNGIIDSDTTWRKLDSPFNLTGPILVEKGVTLTVEAGVTVNLNGHYIRVDGTLSARGTEFDKIRFSGGGSEPPNWSITFTETSTSWSEQDGSGCVLEYVVLDSAHTGISIEDVAPKIDNNFIRGYYAVDVFGGSPVISNNIIDGAIGVHYASPTITGNTITGSISAFESLGQTLILENTIVGGGQNVDVPGIVCSHANVTGNVIYGFVSGGIVAEFKWGHSPVIEENLIMYNSVGINVSQYANPQIWCNTIANNSLGIAIAQGSLVNLLYNSIQDNVEYNLYLSEYSEDVDADDNWWGTTSYYPIADLIFDFEDDFNLGTVDFTPILTEPYPKAPSLASAPEPTPTPTPVVSPEGTPNSGMSLRDLEVAILVLLIIVAGLLVVTIVLLLRKGR